ncbi:MAG: hypothetical protein ACOYO9_00650 [Candidatus Nanopelagicales bacterium]|jgi:hypothetical protein
MPVHDQASSADKMPEDLLAEAAAGLQSDIDADVLAEAAEILTAERVSLCIVDRLSAAPRPVTLTLRSGCVVEGMVREVGDRVVVLADGAGAEHCIAIAGVVTARGLPAALSNADVSNAAENVHGVHRRSAVATTWGSYLRASTGVEVRIILFDGTSLTGLAALVGADHIDLLMADGAVTTCSLAWVSRVVRLWSRG